MTYVSIATGEPYEGKVPEPLELPIYVKEPIPHYEQATVSAKDDNWPEALNRWMYLQGYIDDNSAEKALTIPVRIKLKGGPGSGNWGHAGRPGMVGGSAPTKTGIGAMMSPTSGPSAAQRQQEAREAGKGQIVLDYMQTISLSRYTYLHSMTNMFAIDIESTRFSKGDIDALDKFHKGLITEQQLIDKVFSKYEYQPPQHKVASAIKNGGWATEFLPKSQQMDLAQQADAAGMYRPAGITGEGIITYHEFEPHQVQVIADFYAGKTPEYVLWRDVLGNPNHPDAPKPKALEARQYEFGVVSTQSSDAGYTARQGHEVLSGTTAAILEARGEPPPTINTKGELMVEWEQRTHVKDEVVTEMARRSGASYAEANAFIHQWANSSNDTDMRSLAMQQDAAKEFGVSLSEWQQAQIDYTMKVGGAAWAGGKSLLSSDTQRGLLRAMYDNTQSVLKEMGLKPDETITLYRGVGWDSIRDEQGNVLTGTRPAGTLNYVGNAMESWTPSMSTASVFGQLVVQAQVPVKNILSTAVSGYGCLSEYEFVVLGLSAKGTQVHSF